MEALIAAALVKLKTDITYVRDVDIYVTEDLELIRMSGGYPAIALKDGGTVLATETANQGEDVLTLRAGIYTKLHKPGAAIMGDSSASEKGLLVMAKEVLAALDDTFTGVADLSEQVSIGESKPLPIDETRALQMIDVTLRYTRWR
jgi:hypothetical protein